jgi:hypothetical protein
MEITKDLVKAFENGGYRLGVYVNTFVWADMDGKFGPQYFLGDGEVVEENEYMIEKDGVEIWRGEDPYQMYYECAVEELERASHTL